MGSEDYIKGGYVLKPRKIKNSDISNSPPCVRETWDYLIREANHEDFNRGNFTIKRGQLFRSYSEIRDALCWYVGWRKETYSEDQMKKAMKALRDNQRIHTQKAPGGVLITVCNYTTYQDPSNYESTKERTKERTTKAPLPHHRRTSYNNKNEKNVKKKNKTLLFDLQSNEFDISGTKKEKVNWTTVRLHEILRKDIGHYKSMKKATLEDWRDHIRLMHEEDNLSFEDIWDLLKFAMQDNFWKSTVKSTSGLRNNWEEIDSSKRKQKNNGKRQPSKDGFDKQKAKHDIAGFEFE